jgi:MoxR-like ATPase
MRKRASASVVVRDARPWEDERLVLGAAYDEPAPLLGRVQEQNLLTLLLEEVTSRGRALVIRGEPGIGKSRLLSEAARAARDRGMVVLTTTGVQSGGASAVCGAASASATG